MTKKRREANHNSALQTLLYYSIELYSDTFLLKSPQNCMESNNSVLRLSDGPIWEFLHCSFCHELYNSLPY